MGWCCFNLANYKSLLLMRCNYLSFRARNKDGYTLLYSSLLSSYNPSYYSTHCDNVQICRAIARSIFVTRTHFNQLSLRPRRLIIRRYSARFRRIIVNYTAGRKRPWHNLWFSNANMCKMMGSMEVNMTGFSPLKFDIFFFPSHWLN